MGRWAAWIVMGIVLALAILLATCMIGFARMSPRIARRLAGGSLAAALLGMLLGVANDYLLPRGD